MTLAQQMPMTMLLDERGRSQRRTLTGTPTTMWCSRWCALIRRTSANAGQTARAGIRGAWTASNESCTGCPSKTWLALDFGIAVSTGGKALGTNEVQQGDVLYLALEDNRRRLQKRLSLLHQGATALERLHIALEWPRLDDGGVEKLEAFLIEHPETRLVVIDTLKKVRPRVSGDRSVYEVDYEALEPLIPLAATYGISILVIHHSRKAEAEDPWTPSAAVRG
jgi:RecA-family ATPase